MSLGVYHLRELRGTNLFRFVGIRDWILLATGCRPFKQSQNMDRQEARVKAKQQFAFLKAAHRWTNGMPKELFGVLSGSHEDCLFTSWFGQARAAKKYPDNVFKVWMTSPYRQLNRAVRQGRREVIQREWDARQLSRATPFCSAQIKRARL